MLLEQNIARMNETYYLHLVASVELKVTYSMSVWVNSKLYITVEGQIISKSQTESRENNPCVRKLRES